MISYSEAIKQPGRTSVLLAEFEFGKAISKIHDSSTTWATVSSPYTNARSIACNIVFDGIRRDIHRVMVKGVEYTKVGGVNAVHATTKTFYHDAANGILYVRPPASIDLNEIIVIAFFKFYAANYDKDLNFENYPPYLDSSSSAFQTTISVKDEFFGFASASSGGELRVINAGADPYGNLDDEMGMFDLRGTVQLKHGIDLQGFESVYSDYRSVRNLEIGDVDRNDRQTIFYLRNRTHKAKKSKAAQVFYHTDALTDEEDYHGQGNYSNMDTEHIGEPQASQIGSTDNSGNAQQRWEQGVNCICTEKGTPVSGGGNKNTKWKVGGVHKDPITESNHGMGIGSVLHKAGEQVTIVPASNYTTTGESSTLIQFQSNYKINLQTDHIRATTDGHKDVSGRFTGSGSSVIQKPQDAMQYYFQVLGNYRPTELDIPSMTASGVSKTVDGVVYAGTMDTSAAWYGNALLRSKHEEQSLEEVVDILAKSLRSCVVEGNEGQITNILLSSLKQNTDAFIDADLDVLDWNEKLPDFMASRIFVEYGQVPAHEGKDKHNAGGRFNRVASKKTTPIGATNVQNNYVLSLKGRRDDKTVTTAIKSKNNAKALANAWADTYRFGANKLFFKDATGALMQSLPGQRVIVSRSRSIGGSINEKAFWITKVSRDYARGVVDVEAIEAK